MNDFNMPNCDSVHFPQRQKTNSNNLPHLDGWRGFAIFLVFMAHFAGSGTGDVGVQIFFVLSGMLMSQVLFVDKLPLGTFYLRRIARVFPVFYLYLATIGAGSWLLTRTRPLGELAFAATFLRTYFPYSIWNETLPTGHIWSLNVEEHSYVLLSFIALFASRYSTAVARFALPIATLGCLVAYAAYSIWPPGDFESPAKLRSECAAFALLLSASLHLWLKSPTKWMFWLAVLATLSAYVLSSMLAFAPNPLKLIVLPAALALLVNTLTVAPNMFLASLSARWLTWLGTISFSLYIWQQLFHWLAMREVINTSLAGALSVIAGAGSFYFFEQPSRRFIRDLSATSIRRTAIRVKAALGKW